MSVSATLPLIDLSCLNDPSLRSQTIERIQTACKEFGFFQVINHGISESVAKDAVEAAMKFFELPEEEKMSLASDDIYKPVRYGTNIRNDHAREGYLQRSFLKQYSLPISKWIHLWPENPPSYKEKMGQYVAAVQELQKLVMDLVLESLGLNPSCFQKEIEEGMHVVAVNFYPFCSEPHVSSGLGPHTDHGLLTIGLQSSPGIQLKTDDDEWVKVPLIEGALLVLLGDQMEVLSNGIYKSVVHQAISTADQNRISIASISSYGLEEKVRPAPLLVNEERTSSYEESSFKDFLDFLSRNEKQKIRFIDTLKKNPIKGHA